MKKLLATFTAAALVLSLAACSGNSMQESGSAGGSVQENSTAEVTMPAESNVTIAPLQYMTFDECLLGATNIVEATYTGESREVGIYTHYNFLLNNNLKGTIDDKSITVVDFSSYSGNVEGENAFGFEKSSLNYKTNKKYILVLEKHISVYNQYDHYMPISDIRISKDGDLMYGNNSVSSNMSEVSTLPTEEDRENYEYDWYVNYIKEFCAASPGRADEYVGSDYIRSTELSDIVANSEYILKVTPKELEGQGKNKLTERYICEVDDVIKGEISDRQMIVIFTENTVKPDQQYIVLLAKSSGLYNILSSKNSVYPITDTENVDAITKLCQRQS